MIIGALASIGLGAFALVPLDSISGKPPKPLFYYLIPLVRIQVRADVIVPDGMILMYACMPCDGFSPKGRSAI